MRYIFFTYMLLSVSLFAFSQRPELPREYFSGKLYTISAGLNINDSVAVRREINRLADSIYVLCKKASSDYHITDSVLRREPSLGISITAPCLNRYKEAYDSLMAFTKALTSRTTVSSVYFTHELYLLYHLSGTASPTLLQAINKKIASLDKDYQKDNVNTLKGAFHEDYIKVLNQRIITTLQQAIESSHGKIDYGNAAVMIRNLLMKDLLVQHHALLQKTLYALDPSRVERTEVFIPMRDGVKLSAQLFRDVNAKEKMPAIISQSPYPSGTEATRGNIFGSYGYVYIYVDCRGRRDSEGNFFPYENDAHDFYDIIDWASKQPWCNGKVATSGGSYLGFTQWQSIRQPYRHPALKAINPMVSVGFGVDFPCENRIFYHYMLQWAQYVSGRDLNQAQFNDYNFWRSKSWEMYTKHIPFSKYDSLAGLPNAYFQKWVSHPDFDSYWKGILPTREDYASLDIPVLTITGYYDDDQNGAMYYYKNHLRYGSAKAIANHHMLIGPFDHGGSQWNPGPSQAGILIEKAARIPIYKYVIAWFDWRLKGAPKPAWIKDQITYFATGTGQWKGAASFKTLTADTLKFYFTQQPVTSEKRRTIYQLQTAPNAGNESIVYKHDIAQALDSAFIYNDPKPDSDSLDIVSPYNILFETAPFEKDILISDRITADLYASLNVPDADFWVSINEITPDGKSKQLSSAVLRCRYRNGNDRPELMIPGQVEKLPFTNTFVYIKKIAKGSRLRVSFKSLNLPFYEKNYGFGGVVANETTNGPRPIEATIRMSSTYPSCIKVPVGNE